MFTILLIVMNKVPLFLVLFALSFAFAQEGAIKFQFSLDSAMGTPAPVPVPELLPTLVNKPSVAQALSGSNLSSSCTEDFTNLLGKDGFDMGKFMKDLPPDVAKTKLQMKSPFGKPKDGDKTSSGLTVGCIKSLPESPAEIVSLLKNIGLKMGLDMAAGAAANLTNSPIPANVPKESSSDGGGGGFGLKQQSMILAFTAAAAFGAVGIAKHLKAGNYIDKINDMRNDPNRPRKDDLTRRGEYNLWVKDWNTKATILNDSETYRNIYFAGAGVFAVAGALTFVF